jgi:hypothetical protein
VSSRLFQVIADLKLETRNPKFGSEIPATLHPPELEAMVVKLWRNAQWVSFEASAKEDMLRRVPPKTQ